MTTLAVKEVLDQLPQEELQVSLEDFLEPMMSVLPDKRLQGVIPLAVRGILGSESPVITRMAQMVSRTESGIWAAAKRMYGLLKNKRFEHSDMGEGLYTISRSNVERDQPEYLVVAIDPVNFEKPYTQKLEGVSTVH